MAIIRGTPYDDLIKQNSAVAVDIYGYQGNDIIYLNRTDSKGGFNYVDAGSGNDKVVNYFEGGNEIDLGDGNDLYIADIRAGDLDANDEVYGGTGNDRFQVDSEVSLYYGESGNDTFYSVGFNNLFNGGSGTDTISYQLQDDYDSQVGKGVTIDLLNEEARIDADQVEDLIGIENATGTNSLDDIFGTNGRNVLKGLGDDDLIKGNGGNDDLYGGTGNDDLYGGSGADDLTGGSGSDYLNGGSGADVFYFDSISDSVVGAARDIIADFIRSEGDLVDLSNIDADTTLGGNQFFDFIGGLGFSREAGELRFSSGIVQGDVNGDGRVDFQIRMTGITKMYADDFVV